MFSKRRDPATPPFRSRLATWYFILFVASVAVILGAAYGLLNASLQARDRDMLESTLIRYASAYRTGGLRRLDTAIAADRRTGRYEPLFVRVLMPDGAAAAFFSMPTDWAGFDVSKIEARPLDGDRAWVELTAPGRDERLEVGAARLSGGAWLQVGKSTGRRDDVMARFRQLAAVLVAGVLAAALAGAAILSRSALRPLNEMTRAVRDILATGSVQRRVPVAGSGDPLDEAAALMNRMLDRIEALIADLEGSLDNVAHDLRTPLTRLRSTAERGLRPDASAEEARAALAACVEEADRVAGMLEALMDLSEAQTGRLRLDVTPTDLVPVIAAAIELYADFADARGIRLEQHLPPTLVAHVDAIRTRQAIANLIDNAVKYTPRGGTVGVSAAGGAGQAVVTVDDTGPGIEPADLPRIWDRLYRADRSRSTRGLGLGLSLVKAIAEAHGGSAEAHSRPGGGSRFVLRLPA